MLPKKVLPLLLSAGLFFGPSSGVLATGGEQCVSGTSVAAMNTFNMDDVAKLLMIKACREYLVFAVDGIIAPRVIEFCKQLKCSDDVKAIEAQFNSLYKDLPEFREAVNAAWNEDSTSGNKWYSSPVKHSSKINKRSSKINKRSSKINKRSSKINKRSSKINKRSSKINKRSSKINKRSSKAN